MSVRLGAQYIYLIEQGVESGDPTSNKDYKAWLRGMIERILKTKIGEFTVPGPYPTGAQQIILGNPWVSGSVPASSKYIPTISNTMLVKFWLQLAFNGRYFYIDSSVGISRIEDIADPGLGFNFEDIIGQTAGIKNVLGLTTETIGNKNYVKQGAVYVIKAAGDYVDDGDTPLSNEKFTTTEVAPNA